MSLVRGAAPLALCILTLLSFMESPVAGNAPGGEAPGPSPAGDMDIGRWKGRVVLLDFWASWCGPCRESFPWMEEMRSRYGSEGLVVVTVNLDQDRGAADRFLEGRRFDFEYLYDPEGRQAEKWGIESMPASILFDRNGSEAFRHMGFRHEDAATYEAHIRDLLAGAKHGALEGSAPARDDLPAHAELQGQAPDPDQSAKSGDGKIGARPWERACLARPAMRFDGAPLDLSFDDHIYFSREASSGGRGFGGGGCGCN